MILGFDGGWRAYKQQGLRYQRGEEFTMTAIAVRSSRDVSSHSHFCVLFNMPCYLSTLDVFASSNVFHFNAVLSVCWAFKNSDEL